MLKNTLLVLTLVSGANLLSSFAVAQPLCKPDLHKAPRRVTLSEYAVPLGAEFSGNGTSVFAGDGRAWLHCLFQRIDGEATAEGLLLTSMVTNAVSDCFRI